MPHQQHQMANTSTVNANGQSLDYYLSDNVSGNNYNNNNNNDDNERRVSADTIETGQANGNVANRNRDGQAMTATVNGQHLQCDPKTKPIATQPCTTGIECTPITLGTGNIDRGRGADGVEQIEHTKGDDTADTDADDIEATDTNANVESETDEIGVNGNTETDGEDGDTDAEEMEEIEVYLCGMLRCDSIVIAH